MKIVKTTNTHKLCENCEKEHADFDIQIGTKSLQFSLCKSCTWDLADLCNETPEIGFQSAEK